MALLAIIGPLFQISKSGFGMLTYYTTLSNSLVAAFSTYMVWAMVTGRDVSSNRFLRLKAGLTMAILITFVIYHIMLRPLESQFWRPENLLCHYITPLYFCFDTLVFDPSRTYKWYDAFLWTLLPVAYLFFAIINGLFIHIAIPGGKNGYFAYFFLNGPKYGWHLV